MNHKVSAILILAIILIVILTGNSACKTENQVTTGEIKMNQTTTELPLIDTIIPQKTETATFALG
jgi:hypothetical protein